MNQNYQIDQIVERTPAYGTVVIRDVFISSHTGNHCYLVEESGGKESPQQYLCFEEDFE